MIRTGGWAARLCCFALCAICTMALAACTDRRREEPPGAEIPSAEEPSASRGDIDEAAIDDDDSSESSVREPSLPESSAPAVRAEGSQEDSAQSREEERADAVSQSVEADARETAAREEEQVSRQAGRQAALQPPPEQESDSTQEPDAAAEPQRQRELPGGRLDEGRVEVLILQLINEDRLTHGREGLGMQEDMRLAARIRAGEVLDSLSHTRPDGTAYNTAFDEAGFTYAGKYHGENVLMIQSPPDRFTEESLARRIFEELKDSAGHYRNMMQDTYVQAGIGVHIREEDGVVDVGCAQLFAGL